MRVLGGRRTGLGEEPGHEEEQRAGQRGGEGERGEQGETHVAWAFFLEDPAHGADQSGGAEQQEKDPEHPHGAAYTYASHSG